MQKKPSEITFHKKNHGDVIFYIKKKKFCEITFQKNLQNITEKIPLFFKTNFAKKFYLMGQDMHHLPKINF